VTLNGRATVPSDIGAVRWSGSSRPAQLHRI
jgi:hypothetical protein